jgi:hypothetical protein
MEPPKQSGHESAGPEVANGHVPEAGVGEKKKPTRRPNRSKKSETNSQPKEIGAVDTTKAAKHPKSPKKEFRKFEPKTEIKSSTQNIEQKPETQKLELNIPNVSGSIVVGMYHGRGNQNRGQAHHQQPRNAQNQNNQSGYNRNQFQPHYLPEQVQHSLERGLVIEGVLRINPKNYKDAFVNSPCGLTADIMVIQPLCIIKCRGNLLRLDICLTLFKFRCTDIYSSTKIS